METRTIQVTHMGDPGSVAITFLIDGVVQEASETLSLELVPTPSTLRTLPSGEAVFFVSTINLTILDIECRFRFTVYHMTVD